MHKLYLFQLCFYIQKHTTLLEQKQCTKTAAAYFIGNKKGSKPAGKYVGLSTGDIRESTLRHWQGLGVDMLSAGADYDFLREANRANLHNLTRILKQG